ncbi:MAG: hypothetical protein JNM91_01500, partial [Flavobacteriales bacterium]|nr:hypothetical protein [Flavobacteriales bacterium]
MLQKKFIGFLGIMSLTCAAQVPFDLDGGFQTSIQSQTIASLVPLANGKLMVAGLFDYPGAGNQLKLGRLDENGDWDITYSASSLGGGTITPWQDRFYVQSTTVVRRILDGGTMDAEFIEMNTGPYFQS